MGLVDFTPYQQPQNSTSDGSKFDNLLTAIQAAFNGGIDDANIGAAAAIALSKLAQSGATIGEVMAWGGSAWAPTTLPSTELDFLQITTPPPGINATTEGTAQMVLATDVDQPVTVTIASPAVCTRVAHGMSAGRPVAFQTTGALPTGLTPGTVYYVIAAGLTADSFEVSATLGGSAVNTSGTQSGTHTLYKPVTYAGTRIKVEAFVPAYTATAAMTPTFVLLRDSVVLGQFTGSQGGTTIGFALTASVFDTPSAGPHTYALKAFVAGASTMTVTAGAGGSGNKLPAYIRTTEA